MAISAVYLAEYNLAANSSEKVTFSHNAFFAFPHSISPNSSPDSQKSDCTRSTPKSIVNQSKYSNQTFSLSDDKRTGTETVALPGNRKLKITNTGCEYYHLIFQFETSEYSSTQIASKDSRFWYKEIIQFLKIVRGGVDPPIQLDKAVGILNQTIKKREMPQFEIEIDFGGTDLRTFLTVQPIQVNEQNKVVLEISFSVGPL